MVGYGLKSLLHFSNLQTTYSTHHDGTHYACVFCQFHDNHQGNCSLLLLLHFSNLQTIQCMKARLGTHVYFSVCMTTHEQKEEE